MGKVSELQLPGARMLAHFSMLAFEASTPPRHPPIPRALPCTPGVPDPHRLTRHSPSSPSPSAALGVHLSLIVTLLALRDELLEVELQRVACIDAHEAPASMLTKHRSKLSRASVSKLDASSASSLPRARLAVAARATSMSLCICAPRTAFPVAGGAANRCTLDPICSNRCTPDRSV